MRHHESAHRVLVVLHQSLEARGPILPLSVLKGFKYFCSVPFWIGYESGRSVRGAFQIVDP